MANGSPTVQMTPQNLIQANIATQNALLDVASGLISALDHAQFSISVDLSVPTYSDGFLGKPYIDGDSPNFHTPDWSPRDASNPNLFMNWLSKFWKVHPYKIAKKGFRLNGVLYRCDRCPAGSAFGGFDPNTGKCICNNSEHRSAIMAISNTVGPKKCDPLLLLGFDENNQPICGTFVPQDPVPYVAPNVYFPPSDPVPPLPDDVLFHDDFFVPVSEDPVPPVDPIPPEDEIPSVGVINPDLVDWDCYDAMRTFGHLEEDALAKCLKQPSSPDPIPDPSPGVDLIPLDDIDWSCYDQMIRQGVPSNIAKFHCWKPKVDPVPPEIDWSCYGGMVNSGIPAHIASEICAKPKGDPVPTSPTSPNDPYVGGGSSGYDVWGNPVDDLPSAPPAPPFFPSTPKNPLPVVSPGGISCPSGYAGVVTPNGVECVLSRYKPDVVSIPNSQNVNVIRSLIFLAMFFKILKLGFLPDKAFLLISNFFSDKPNETLKKLVPVLLNIEIKERVSPTSSGYVPPASPPFSGSDDDLIPEKNPFAPDSHIACPEGFVFMVRSDGQGVCVPKTKEVVSVKTVKEPMKIDVKPGTNPYRLPEKGEQRSSLPWYYGMEHLKSDPFAVSMALADYGMNPSEEKSAILDSFAQSQGGWANVK